MAFSHFFYLVSIFLFLALEILYVLLVLLHFLIQLLWAGPLESLPIFYLPVLRCFAYPSNPLPWSNSSSKNPKTIETATASTALFLKTWLVVSQLPTPDYLPSHRRAVVSELWRWLRKPPVNSDWAPRLSLWAGNHKFLAPLLHYPARRNSPL